MKKWAKIKSNHFFGQSKVFTLTYRLIFSIMKWKISVRLSEIISAILSFILSASMTINLFEKE